MIQSEVRPVASRTELRDKRLLAIGLLSFSADLFVGTVRKAESAGDKVNLVGFSVLSNNFETVLQLALDVKRRIARDGNLHALQIAPWATLRRTPPFVEC